jgi:hypothetical protein
MRTLVIVLVACLAPSLTWLLVAWVGGRWKADRVAALRADGPRCGHRCPDPNDELAPDLTCQDAAGHDPLVHYSGAWFWTSQDAAVLTASRGRATPGREAA